MKFNVSIVLFNTPKSEILNVVNSLRKSDLIQHIYLIDNSAEPTNSYEDLEVDYCFAGKNRGYGAAHNIAIKKSVEQGLEYHLVMNSDILLDSSIFDVIVNYLEQHKDVAQIMPKVYYPDGNIQYLCKQLPTPMDLIGRRFLPPFLIKSRNYKFELHQSGYDHIMNIPYLSGCFMFLRLSALKKIGLFDESFFMYSEDIDLTRRLHRKYRTLYFPEVSIVHNHRKGSYKSLRLLWIHLINLAKYFNKWGWFEDEEREQVNKQLLQEITITQ